MDAAMKAAKDSVFSLLYVIKEGAEQRTLSRVGGLLSLTVEMLQVVRVITHVTYGWTHESQAMARWFDLVAVVVDQVRQWVPDLYFYILACVLVVVACADSMLIIKMIQDDRVLRAVWPLKVLRFLVATIVTTLLSTTLEFLLYPLDCTADGTTFSEWVHGDGGGCSPFGMPDVFLSVFTILIVLVFVVFAMGVNLFAFEINPIARGSRAVCTGRVEVAWTAFKIAAGLLPFLSPIITPIAVSIVLSLFAARAVWDHTLRLPFQSKSCNIFRGGVHAAALWLCLASVGVSAVGGSYTEKQGMQWALLGLVPIAFLAGAAGVLLRMRIVHRCINILRAEYDRSLMEMEASSDSETWPRKGAVHTPKVQKSLAQDTNLSSPSAISAVETHRMRTGYDKFFDTAWKDRRAFRTSADALLSCRHLLGLRDKHDLPFLNFVVGKGLAEHPESLDLLFFQLVALHFIYGDTKQAQEQEKKLQDKKGIFIDRSFHLYAVMRKSKNDMVSSSLGNEVNLIEFDSKMSLARRSHQNCLSLMKKFFHLVVKQEKSGSTAYGRPSPALIDDMVAAVHKYEAAVGSTKSEYKWLMDKFPKSTSVILSYAHFTDTVLNDIKAAKALRLKAAVLENEGMVDVSEEVDDKKFGDNVSSISSDNDSRANIARFMQSWRNDIVGSEFATLTSLQMRVQITLVLILIISTAGFVLMDSILFSEQANENIRLIDKAGLFRSKTTNAAFWLRSEMMAAHAGDIESYTTFAGLNDKEMKKLHLDHVSNFKGISSGAVDDFYHAERPISTPMVIGWDQVGYDFWNFGVDMARRGRLAASTPMAELADPNYKLDEISTEKRSVIYVQEVVFRQAIPYFFDVVLLYDENVAIFGDTARTVVAVNAVVNALLVILLSYMTITTIRVLTTVQYQVVACRLALALPRVTAKKLYKFYHTEHHQLTVIGDEEAEKDDIMAGEGNTEGGFVADGKATSVGSGEGGNNPSAEKWDRLQEATAEVPTESDFQRPEDIPRQKLYPLENGPASDVDSSRTSVKLKSALKSRAAPADPPNYSSSVELTPAALLSLQRQLEDDNGPDDSNMQHYLTEEYALHRPEDIVLAINSTGSPTFSAPAKEEVPGDTTTRRRGEKGSSPLSRGREVDVAGVRLRSSMGFTDKGSKGKGHKEGKQESRKEDHASPQSGDVSGVTVSGGQFGSSVGGGFGQSPSAGAGSAQDDAQDSGTSTGGGFIRRVSVGNAAASAALASAGAFVRRNSSGNTRVSGNTRDSTQSPGPRSAMRRPSSEITRDIEAPDGEQKLKRRVSMEAPVEQEATKTPPEDPEGSPRPNSPIRSVAGKNLSASTPEELREMDPEVEADIIQSVTALHQVHNRVSTYMAVLVLILVMCVCSIVVPSRFIEQMVNLGPTFNHAAYRRTLVKSCAHLTRELVLNDGFSRMTQGEIAGTLHGMLTQLRQSDKAVRRGNLLRIGQGADYWSNEHNHVMYDPGCPWKSDGNCSTPDYPAAGTGGVYGLSLQFMGSVEAVLETYGGKWEEWDDTFHVVRELRELAGNDFQTVTYNETRRQVLETDQAVRFVLQGFSGDLFNGYALVLDVLKNEMNTILSSVHFELRLMYGVYVALLILGFYLVLFRRTISGSVSHTNRARDFVQMLPSHILSRGELELLRDHFCGSKDDF